METSELREVVAILKEGDKVRATFDNGYLPGDPLRETYVVEGVLRDYSENGWELKIGGSGMRVRLKQTIPADGVISVEILERAEQPFYTNQPASRKPRIGDVGQVAVNRYVTARYVWQGRYWVAVNEVSDEDTVTVYLHKAGRVALVDPSELEDERGQCDDCETNGRNCREHR